METVPVVVIKVEPCKGNPEGLVEINESDYDPAIHKLAFPPQAEVTQTFVPK